jgi:hypothetical protein
VSAILWSWAVSALVLILIAVLLGRYVRLPPANARPKPRWLGILVDDRARFSLNRTQLVLWSIVVISLISGVFFGRLIEGVSEPLEFEIPGDVLGLLGISVGAAVTVGAVKASKSKEALDETEANRAAAAAAQPPPPAPAPGAPAAAAIAGPPPLAGGPAAAAGGAGAPPPPAGGPGAEAGAPGGPPPQQSPVAPVPRAMARLATFQATGRPPFLGQVFMVEEGEYADEVVDVTKFQSFGFTVVLVVAYVAMAINSIVEAKTAAAVTSLPDLKGTFLVLIGISYTGYAGGKLPPRSGTPRIVQGK